MNKADVKKLKAASQKSTLEHSVALNAKHKERDRLREIEADRIDALVDAKHNGGIEAKHRAACDALVAYEQAAVELAQSGADAPYPLGTTMCEWEIPNSRFHFNRGADPTLTGKKGIIEVFKRGDDYTGGAYRAPEVGDFVIRLLKKDGGLGKGCVSTEGYDFTNWWRPEGVELKR